MKIEDDPTPIGVARDSVRLCWSCEDEIALASDDFREVVLQYPRERGHGSSRARFCSRECWAEWASVDIEE